MREIARLRVGSVHVVSVWLFHSTLGVSVPASEKV